MRVLGHRRHDYTDDRDRETERHRRLRNNDDTTRWRKIQAIVYISNNASTSSTTPFSRQIADMYCAAVSAQPRERAAYCCGGYPVNMSPRTGAGAGTGIGTGAGMGTGSAGGGVPWLGSRESSSPSPVRAKAATIAS